MRSSLILLSLWLALTRVYGTDQILLLNGQGYFETRGLNVMVFSNWYNGNFGDSKMSGVEIIHHGVRTATNGDVRLSPTPGQWDSLPQYVGRNILKERNTVETVLKYPTYGLQYTITAEAQGSGIFLSVNLKAPLPRTLEGLAGFNLEFLPSAYFEKTFLMDGKAGVFPLYPTGSMEKTASGTIDPGPIARGKTLVLAPEDSTRRVTITCSDGELLLYDGRNKAQNGWFVVRSLIPSAKTGKAVSWHFTANTIPDWTRPPVIAHSQVGYHPGQRKVAVIELDVNDFPQPTARVLRVNEDGTSVEKWKGKLKRWGKYLRYDYSLFDFSPVKEPGIYVIEYSGIRTKPFRIARDVYENAWQPTLDIFFPVQMDHMRVTEAYRVWHGAAHLDDALQAPVNHEHFDLYAQGPETDSPYKPGEHIPGLNVGGWFDAGDFDIRTQSQCAVVLNMVDAWEAFGIRRDETTVDQKNRRTEIHRPDGKPDLLQQIEHGTLQLLGQQRSVGHAINGIMEAHLSQYTHLGDASTITDNLVYNSRLDSLQFDGFSSGTFDDRWAFTTKSTALNYECAAALAAASRALRGFDDSLADASLAAAKRIWDDEHSHPPDVFHHGNTTGGQIADDELKAAVELLVCTKAPIYAERIYQLWPTIEQRFGFNASAAVRAMPFMDRSYARKLEGLVRVYARHLDTLSQENPFGVPISMTGWAGNGWVIGFTVTNYFLHKAFPSLVDAECVFRGLNYIYGCHPGSDISFVSDVGTVSKKIAYGNNRADFSFIAGGVVPGVLILPPDFPENKEDWPFLWSENEYVIGSAAGYLFAANAVHELLR